SCQDSEGCEDRGQVGVGMMSWTPELMMTVRSVDAVRPSPDGQWVVYTVTEAITTPDHSEYITQIYRACTDTSASVLLTDGSGTSMDPQWSPNGEFLAFVSDRSGLRNLYLLHIDGGAQEQLTDVRTAITAFAWSPDGQRIALTIVDAPTADEER